MSSDWVVQRMKIFCHVVGLSREGFEEQMLDLFTTIEASWNQNNMVSIPNFCSKTDNRGKIELKRFACSINYDLKGGQNNKDKGKGKGIRMHIEAKDTILECERAK
jgi:hypothetical protein